MNTSIMDKVIEQLKTLPHGLQRRVLEFTRALALSAPRGVPGRQLLRFADTIPPDDVQRMREAIEQDGERANVNDRSSAVFAGVKPGDRGICGARSVEK